MEKMISVINDNLKSVVNGIKEHKSSTEKLLDDIKFMMDEKVALAGDYKNLVENAKKNIEEEEYAINNLERDLEDIKLKFSGDDFKEILTASHKEINNKINEKKRIINTESEKIIDLTEKAHRLKDDLVTLKQRKEDAEEDIKNSEVLIKYYEARVNDVINYATDHTDELASYIKEETPQEDLIANQVDYTNVDLNTIIDGSVFDEIENINSIEIDDDILNQALKDVENHVIEEEEVDEVTEVVNEIINEAKDVIESTPIEETVVEETPVQETIIEEITPTEVTEVEEIKIEEEPDMINSIELNIPDEEPVETEVIPPIEELKKYGLSEFEFDFNDYKKLEEDFSASKFDNFIKIINEYNIPNEVIYNSVDTYKKFDVTDIDKILSLLKETGVTGKTISLVFKYLSDINLDTLESVIKSNRNQEITDILYQVLPFVDRKTLERDLNITKDELKELKSTVDKDTYNKMIMLPEIVKANYKTLEDLHIDNIRECLIKHPTRLLYNPENLNDIFDKYDTEDLIRCINKNATVLDKL